MQEKDVLLLDQNTANQIAAGEVVEKPASVVKELVENALDAGATNIEVSIFQGGTEYIRIQDNGSGMTEANARMAVLRHATSKLRKADDLLSITSLGFRGEALPSIASVSNFTLLTRTENEEFATSIHIDGGSNMEVSTAGGAQGTTVIVENLFFNVPARRKFLKTVATEGRYISELLTKLALARPDVHITLKNNDKEVLNAPGDGDLKNTIRQLYGKNVSSELLAVDFKDPNVKIYGYIGKPTLLKNTRQWQTIFVNGRSIQNKMLSKAIDHAYQSQIPKSGFPFAVLNIIVDTASIDVNVHPQKSEIKFSDDGLIYRAMFKALTDALTRPMSAQREEMVLLPDNELNVFLPKHTLVEEGEQDSFLCETALPAPNKPKENPRPAVRMESIFKAHADLFKAPASKENHGKVASQDLGFVGNEPKEVEEVFAPSMSMQEAVEEFAKFQPLASAAESADKESIYFTDTDSGIATIWPIGQVDKTFIIAQSDDCLYLIDQHAAHERILFDKFCVLKDGVPSQQLLMPLYINMSAEEIALIEEHADEFLRLGVDAGAAGENMLRVSSLPVDIKSEDAEDFINEIGKSLMELRTLNPSDLRQEILHMTACKAAIKAGQVLNMRQMRQLIIDLLNTTHPFTCPHGRPCMIAIDSDKLYKMFKRMGF